MRTSVDENGMRAEKLNRVEDAAEKLFYEKGYAETSVQDILEASGISKSAFYKYYDGKHALLQSICTRYAAELCFFADAMVRQEERTPSQQLNVLLSSSTLWQSGNMGFVSLLLGVAYQEEEGVMRLKMRECQIRSMRDSVARIIAEGVSKGLFYTIDISVCANMILQMYLCFTEHIALLMASDLPEKEFEERVIPELLVTREAIERTLRAPMGSIVLFETENLLELGRKIREDRMKSREPTGAFEGEEPVNEHGIVQMKMDFSQYV